MVDTGLKAHPYPFRFLMASVFLMPRFRCGASRRSPGAYWTMPVNRLRASRFARCGDLRAPAASIFNRAGRFRRRPTTVACIVEANSRDENYRFLQENHERLQTAVDQNGAKLSVIKLPCPEPVYDRGVRLPASYANFYIANEVVLVPIFDDPRDVDALGLLQELFPNRKVHGLRCNDVVAGLGAIHCVTQQQPQPPL